jgi:hypothetical protein
MIKIYFIRGQSRRALYSHHGESESIISKIFCIQISSSVHNFKKETIDRKMMALRDPYTVEKFENDDTFGNQTS